MIDPEDLRRLVEAVIFAAGSPTRLAQLQRAFPELSRSRLAQIVREINEALRKGDRPYEIVEVAGGYQFRTLLEYGEVIRSAQPERKTRLSRPALETLAVIAYRQPLTRAEIEDLRCVDCGAVLKGLLERNLIRIVGRRDAPGRPVLYGTTSNFLEIFGLGSLRDLPALRELEMSEADEGTPAELASQALAEVAVAEPTDGDAASWEVGERPAVGGPDSFEPDESEDESIA